MKFQIDCGEVSKQLSTHKSNLRVLLNDPSQVSPNDELCDNKEKAELLLTNLIDLLETIENLSDRAKQLEPFQQRKIRLVDPYNKCRCLVKLERTQIKIEENEVCLIEDNSQKFKWKIKKIRPVDFDQSRDLLKNETSSAQYQSVLLPSVCFSLLSNDNDSIDLTKQYVRTHSLSLNIDNPSEMSDFLFFKAPNQLLESDQAGPNMFAKLPEGCYSQDTLRDHAMRFQ